jgi:hypothetical protein
MNAALLDALAAEETKKMSWNAESAMSKKGFNFLDPNAVIQKWTNSALTRNVLLALPF